MYISSVGDSRAYLIRSGKIEQLTVDHSIAQALVEAKTLRRIAQGAGKKAGGLGRVIRPRAATVKVRDDEQE